MNGGAAGYVEQQLPIRTNGIDYSVKSGYLDWTKSLSSGDNQHDLIRILNARWMMENAFSWLFGAGAFTGAEYVYGWAPNSGYSGGHADMPVYPHAGGLGKVGIGTDQPGASTDNPGAGALIFAHELIHNYDVKHTDTGGDDCGSNDSTSDFPYASSSIQEFGFNPITGKIYNPANTHDVMSYCPAGGSKEGWLSPYTWNYMFSRLDATVMAAEAQVNRPQIMRTNGVSESLVVNLTIFNPDSAGFDPATPGALGELYRVPGGIEYLPIAGGYAIQLTNGEQVLSSQSFEVNFTSEYHGDGHTNGHSDAHTEGPSGEEPPFSAEPTSKVDRSFIMPWAEGATLVRLVKNEGESSTVLAEKAVSSSAPTVVITTPAADVDWPAGSTQTLAWSGDDGDGDSLSYSVLYSADSGQSWELLVSEWLTPSLELPVDALRGSNDARFRVVATDGINIGFDESDVAITIPNKAPEVTIISPFTGLTIGPGELAVLYGSASDLEDGSLADEAMVWSSNLQGDLGVGSSIPVNTLGAGNHTLTLTARDAQGISSSASVNVFVGVKLYLPLMME